MGLMINFFNYPWPRYFLNPRFLDLFIEAIFTFFLPIDVFLLLVVPYDEPVPIANFVAIIYSFLIFW